MEWSQMVANKAQTFVPWRNGLWRFRLPDAGRSMIAGVTDRSATLETLRAQPAFANRLVLLEQTHGASTVAVESSCPPPADPIPGCDAMTTAKAGIVGIVRTADCLPIFVWDPIRRVVGVAHAGWRGLEKRLPMRLIRFLRDVYHSNPRDLSVGIGPAIHACCYEVGQEFAQRCQPFVRTGGDRLTCDLVGYATEQLLASGVRPARLIDSGCCTACDPGTWHSVRRDGAAAGRLLSFIMMHPERSARPT
ncbi:MAG: polyphenol oxidase family protein [Candidatus Omnitrophica bacterium]|nr:polyphenol oxidase family protein [Candidatus Omnitrophota bacterium]